MSSPTRLFQICYDEATRAAVDPDFEALDNSSSERHDWYEYWPIRSFLSGAALDERSLYGFFSPRFYSKTHLRGAQVREFLQAAEDADVVTFSPHPCHSACFINVFEQGEFFYPGIYGTLAAFLGEVDPGFRPDLFVTHSRNTVFSNYFVARPSFWRRWMALCERLRAHADSPDSPLHAGLAIRHEYRKEGGPAMSVERKVFVLERLASYLLQTAGVRVVNYSPFLFPPSERFVGHLPELIELDRLKLAFSDSGDARHLFAYAELRTTVLRDAYGRMEPTPAG
jgi:hypothetical protein